MPASSSRNRSGRILGWIERTGNGLPDPVFIFFYLILILVAVSVVAALTGYAVPHPTQTAPGTGAPVLIEAVSLLSADNIARLLGDMPTTFAHFHPLGYVVVVMLGAGVAERSGLFGTAMKAAVRNAPKVVLTPLVALVAMVANLAADAAYVVLIPLSGILYHAAGRHPVAGIAAAFAGVSGGFSANLVPGPIDALLFGITEEAAAAIDPGWQANIAGNWFFISAMTVVFLPVIWWVTDRIIEPRLGPYGANDSADPKAGEGDEALTALEISGLRRAGVVALLIVALWSVLTIGPGTPLLDETATPERRLTPLYQSLIAGFLTLFLAAGWVYGKTTGTIKTHRDLVAFMTEAMRDLAYYFVLAFAAAHFVAMFSWSNLGLIFAVEGAAMIRGSGMPVPATLGLLVLFTCAINIFVGSASAKWALLAPVLVPMLMLLGVSPEMTTAAYRVGDSATNIITPLMVYFPLILTFCQRWSKDFGIGSLTATMLPYSLYLLMSGVLLVALWVTLGLPLGPGASADYVMLTDSP